MTLTVKQKERAQEHMDAAGDALREFEKRLKALKSLAKKNGDELACRLLDRAISEADELHITSWAACRAAGGNEGK